MQKWDHHCHDDALSIQLGKLFSKVDLDRVSESKYVSAAVLELFWPTSPLQHRCASMYLHVHIFTAASSQCIAIHLINIAQSLTARGLFAQGMTALSVLPLVLPPAIPTLIPTNPTSSPQQQQQQAMAAMAAMPAQYVSPFTSMMLPPSVQAPGESSASAHDIFKIL